MFYREAGDFKSSYVEDNQTFPIQLDRWVYFIFIGLVLLVVPLVINDYWLNAVILPFLIYSIAALGLNILTGYCGQVSLGTGGFMAVGAYACYKFMTGIDIYFGNSGFVPGGGETIFRGGEQFEITGGVLFFTVAQNAEWIVYVLDPVNIFFSVILAGLVTAFVGILFGLPSLRIKGFYLAVATLAAQFFLVWLFNKWSWAYNYSASGQINAPERGVFGIPVTGEGTAPWAEYLFCLFFVLALAWLARNLTRGTLGRTWMAIRDMDIAAEIIGVNPLRAKLSAFAVSSFFVGVSGALFFAVYLGAVEVGEVYGINKSFLVLFMIIIGGLGSISGSFMGAAFLVLLPVFLKNMLAGAPVEDPSGFAWFVGNALLLGMWLSVAVAIAWGIVTQVRGKPGNGGPALCLAAAFVFFLLQWLFLGGFGWPTDLAAHLEFVIIGALIILFLIVEPHGLAQLWRLAKEKLRLWPFPH